MMGTTGQLLTISNEIAQLEIGVEKVFLNLSYVKYSYLATPTGINSFFEYMEASKAKLKSVLKEHYKIQHKGDKYIM